MAQVKGRGRIWDGGRIRYVVGGGRGSGGGRRREKAARRGRNGRILPVEGFRAKWVGVHGESGRMKPIFMVSTSNYAKDGE